MGYLPRVTEHNGLQPKFLNVQESYVCVCVCVCVCVYVQLLRSCYVIIGAWQGMNDLLAFDRAPIQLLLE
jgi:hypothetical protein